MPSLKLSAPSCFSIPFSLSCAAVNSRSFTPERHSTLTLPQHFLANSFLSSNTKLDFCSYKTTTTRDTPTTYISKCLHNNVNATMKHDSPHRRSYLSHRCAVCQRPGKLCSGCQDIRYCCRAHQKDDWPTHRMVCKTFAQCELEPPPGKVWALYFPVDRTQPEFRLISTDGCSEQSETALWEGVPIMAKRCLEVKVCSDLCTYDNHHYTHRFWNVFSSHHDIFCLTVFIGAPKQSDMLGPSSDPDLKVNQCVQTLTGVTCWKGPVIAYAESASPRSKSPPKFECRDIGTSVFTRILDTFRSVRAVWINCDGLVEGGHAPRFEAVTIDSFHLRWEQDDSEGISSITRHTGIELYAEKEFLLRSPAHIVDQRNSKSKLIAIPCDVEQQTFGSYRRDHKSGSVHVIRRDRKPLEVEYVRTLCDWISEELRPLFKKARKECARIRREKQGAIARREQRAIREKVFRRITKQRLLRYSHGRQKDEDTKIPENNDATDDEMPDDHGEPELSENDTDVSDND